MAALQKIRSRGVLLVAVLGLALFAFIAEEFFRALETTSVTDKNQVGSVYGKKLSIQDFQQMVEEAKDATRLSKAMNGQGADITDAEAEQISESVWQEFVSNAIIENECDELGIYVTDGEVQEALRLGTARSLQIMADRTTGRFNLAAVQDFLKNYKKNLAQAQQMQDAQSVEFLEMYKRVWDYTEKQLRNELLAQKYMVLVRGGFVSNKTAAQLAFNNRSVMKNADVAAVPYTSVDDKEVKVTDEDLKAAYEEYKEYFFVPSLSRDLKILDVQVTASAADRAELMKKVQGIEAQLAETEDVAGIVRTSNSEIGFNNLCISKAAFSRIPDVMSRLDSMSVGSVVKTYYNAQDNTVNTLKLIAKTEAPDSVRLCQIYATAATPEARKAQADSILNALNNGAAFADLAKKYGQTGDTAWIYSGEYEALSANSMPEMQAAYLTKLQNIPSGTTEVYHNDQASVVTKVIDRRKMVTKYNVAVVKCTLNFSKKTYEGELSKLNRFLAANKTIESLEANAAKNGYQLFDAPAYNPTNNLLPMQIGGAQSKDAAKWVFDEAEAGQISRLYECGRNNDHLLVVAVTACNEGNYLPYTQKLVKDQLTAIVKNRKKGELLAARLKSAKQLSDFAKQKGVINGHLSAQSFATNAQLLGVNVAEPKLSAAVAKTAVGKCSPLVQGDAAVYILKVTGENKSAEKFDAQSEMSRIAAGIDQRTSGYIFDYLRLRDAEIKDNRYQF